MSRVVAVTLAALLLAGIGGYMYYYGPCGTVRVRDASSTLAGLLAEWDTLQMTFGQTAHAEWAPRLEQFQRIRSQVETFPVPPCMQTAHGYLVSGMERAEQGYAAFVANGLTTEADNHLLAAAAELQGYEGEMARIEACLPFC